MNTDIHTAIGRGFKFAYIFALLVCTAASCGPGHSVASGPRCAFADPEFTTSLGICNLAAEYFVAKHEWPLARAQLEEQNKKMLEEARKDMPPEEAKEMSEFLERFTLLDLKKKGNDLVFHYRFKVEKKTVDQTVTLKPGPTADEILQSATDGKD